jgi:hypothetical protein
MDEVDALRYDIRPDTGEDQTQKFQAMFSDHAADTRFVLRPGRYDFYAVNGIKRDYWLSNSDPINPKYIAILMENMSHVVLDGNGADLIFHGQVLPIAVDGCWQVRLENFSIDWDIPLSAEGNIRSAGDGFMDVNIDPTRFPHRVDNGILFFRGEDWEAPKSWHSLIEFDTDRNMVAYDTGDVYPVSHAESRPDGSVRLTGDFQRVPTPGNAVVIRHNPRWHPGILAQDSQEVTFSGIRMFANGGLGVLCQFCRDLTFRRVCIEPNRRRGRRFVGGHDDGFHFSNNGGIITMEECRFFGLMDDPVNVHGTALRIDAVEGAVLKGSFAHEQSVGMKSWAAPGQSVIFRDHRTLGERGRGRVHDFRLTATDRFILELEEAPPTAVRTGDCLENEDLMPAVVCRRCDFDSCRARGLLVTTSRPVRIEENRFFTSGAAILLSGDANGWYESGACTDVIIRGNIFRECNTSPYQFGSGTISIHPEIPEPEGCFHRNIRVEDNIFYAWDFPLIDAFSTDGLRVRNNRIIRSRMFPPRLKGREWVTLENCEDAVIDGNLFIGSEEGESSQA